MDEPDFKNLRVAIVGLGLMGGSLALAIRDQAREIIGCDADSAAIAFALNHRIISRAADFDSALDCDLIILATPPRVILEQLQAVRRLYASRITRHESIILDLGSTKRAIVDSMIPLPAHFDPVGGHPMCGKEVGGIANADATLFRDKTFILTPLQRTSSRALDVVHQLIRIIGAQPLILDPDHHDSLAAMMSHLPYLTSVALMRSAMTMNDDDVWRIAASGFRDTTRLAASDLTMMMDIMQTNRQAVLELLRRFRNEIDSLITLIESSNFDSLHVLLSSAQTKRSQLFQPVTENPKSQKPNSNHPTT